MTKSRDLKSFLRTLIPLSVVGGVGIGIFFYYFRLETPITSVATIPTETTSPDEASLKSAPLFELNDVSGKKIKLSDFKGTSVILHFWAAWCPPCLEEIKTFKKTAEKYAKSLGTKSPQFIAISLDPKWEQALRILPAANLPPNFTYLIDPTIELPEKYGTYQFPETYVLNSTHKIRKKWVGVQVWESPEVVSEIEKLTSGSIR